MFNIRKITLIFLLLFARTALSNDVNNPCEEIEASSQIALCAQYNKEQSDNLLNSSYKATLNRIRLQYKNSPLLADQYVSLLKKAQREWIDLRDADCKLEAFEIEETAEAYQVTIDNCISRMSDDRADYLNRIAPDI
ncbi:lysozyme inhibitor LprI family protein [Stutzerimonas kunmingensis]|uniref:lysozyme inhibitor LprI family protein n=1 Tax=Stutzerimonas kunmingensis TaxID=1211807 RepID=UPI0028AF00C3|nr:lysozyme inhibitor LprI family protein [Stutzerimonas kunmingensis]